MASNVVKITDRQLQILKKLYAAGITTWVNLTALGCLKKRKSSHHRLNSKWTEWWIKYNTSGPIQPPKKTKRHRFYPHW